MQNSLSSTTSDVRRADFSMHSAKISVRAFVFALVTTLTLGLAPTALAAPNSGPSTAVEVSVGVPFSGDWAGTQRQHITACCDYWHFYRPSFPLRTGDELQLAVDNTQDYHSFSPCLMSPTDEFGARETLERECSSFPDYVAGGAMKRVVLTYSRSRPNGLLAIQHFDAGDVAGRYTVTIERAITRVNIGMVAPKRVGRSFTIKSALRYGDNTPVADGISAYLQFRPTVPGRRTKFKTIARTTSARSAATFKARLPKQRAKSGQLKACVEQPGGPKPRCTRAFRVRTR